MDCCCLWVASPCHLSSTLSTDQEYLTNVGTTSTGKLVAIDYKDGQISLSCRFCAIKLWVVLRRYSAISLCTSIDTAATWFERAVAADECRKVVVPMRVSLVCFCLHQRSDDDAMDDLNWSSLRQWMREGGYSTIHDAIHDGNKFVIPLPSVAP
ncbi:hypothetical protein HU200_023709 [Digitaria exilis]|uniref:Uncharacterized protein n=1 Tax=Digitaria exilis TaxID=1010633 RepID=A0A835CCE2_9POAL|nr:hypothetical protein HU200_023709 [Digitaria exilis]